MYQIIHPGGIFRFLHRLAIIIILRDLMGPENVPSPGGSAQPPSGSAQLHYWRVQ